MSRQNNFDKVPILGVEIDALTIEQAITYILDRAGNFKQPAGYVVKPYVEFMDAAANNPTLKHILNNAELTLADGVALIWAAHYLYAGPHSAWRFWRSLFEIVLAPKTLEWPLPERIAGINLTWPLLEAAAKRDIAVFLIGKESRKDIESTANVVRRQLPKLRIVGTFSGRDPARPLGEVSEAWITEALTAITGAKPDLILVGMGFPLQEQVMSRLTPQLDHGMLIGEGGTFDYEQFGGKRKKAPRIMQRLGLEWFWRLLLQPQRIRRQLAIPRFIWRIWRVR